MNPVTSVEGNLVKVECPECHREFTLDAGEEEFREGSLAHRIGVAMAGVMRCDECLVRNELAEQMAATARARESRLSASNLPEPLRGFTFEEMFGTGRRAEVIEAAREWAEDKGSSRGLCLYGGVGAGKTRLAATAAWTFLERQALSWVSVPVLVAQVGAAWDDADRKGAIRIITGKGPLVLDDLDKVKPSDWVRSQLFAAIDSRVQANRPLLVTTNLAPAKLEEMFGEAITSRLIGHCRPMALPGPDYRMRLPSDEAATVPDAAGGQPRRSPPAANLVPDNDEPL